MWDSVLGMFGQSAEQAARRDMDDYTTAGKGGLKPREGAEVIGDFLRGGSDSVNEAARQLYTEGLQNKYGRDLEDYTGVPAEITATTGEGSLRRKTRDAKRAYDRDTRTEDYKTNPLRIEQEGARQDALRYQQGRDKELDRRFDAGRLDAIDARRAETQLGMAQLDIARQQEANRMFEETRRYDQRRADSKRERMQALIAGLANLGGAFII